MEQPDKEYGRIARAIADLFPGYFALVMATGITSIAANLKGLTAIAWALLYLNIAAFTILSVMLLIRIVRFFPRVRADINDHMRGPGFFTVVAGTCVLGSQLVLVGGHLESAAILWFVGLVLWALIIHGSSILAAERMCRSAQVTKGDQPP